MSLRLIWQIFLKDVQRLWWVILLTLLLLGRLAHFDSWRGTRLPNSEEGWLNILLPLAWSLLIALAVFEDSAAAESPFWITLPCRWRPILGAKALFTLAFVHVPYFVACAMILQSRGLGVVENIPALLLRQLILLAFTIPAIALATVVRNVTQYMCVAIVLATFMGTMPMGGAPFVNEGFVRGLREAILFSLTAIAGVWIVFAQYRHRFLTPSRAVGIAAVAIATVIWWLPREHFDRLQVAFSPLSGHLPPPGIQLGKGKSERGFVGGNVTGVFIPITTSAPPPGYSADFRQSSLRIRESDGHKENARTQSFQIAFVSGARILTAGLSYMGGTAPTQQMIAMDEPTWIRIGRRPVTIQGSALVTYRRDGEPIRIALGQSVPIPGVGICTSQVMDDSPQNESVRVSCESARALPLVHVTLLDPVGNRHWDRDLNSSRDIVEYPTGTWLSPVDRADVYFPLTDEEHYDARGGQWQTPREVVPTAKIGITPSFPQGSALIHYELPNIRLDQYQYKGQ